MMAGANPASVQKIMRHTNPRLTTEVYGHLAPEYLQAEANRLKLLPIPSEYVTQVLPPAKSAAPRDTRAQENSTDSETCEMVRPAGLEPTTPGLEGRCSIQLSYGRLAAESLAILVDDVCTSWSFFAAANARIDERQRR